MHGKDLASFSKNQVERLFIDESEFMTFLVGSKNINKVLGVIFLIKAAHRYFNVLNERM